MPRYKCLVEYCGSSYSGWQKQLSNLTIQEELEKALYKFSSHKVNVIGSSRTDSGVHARGQVAHFDLEEKFTEFNILNGINFYLPKGGISVLKIEKVNRNFHSRALAIRRHYQYLIINRRSPLTIEQDKAMLVKHPLNIEAMKAATKFLIGKHDFSSFRSAECVSSSPVKQLSKLNITKIGDMIYIDVAANSFLHHMVRNIVGTLLLVGQEKITPDFIAKILASKSRDMSGATAPACGLYLMQVDYE